MSALNVQISIISEVLKQMK